MGPLCLCPLPERYFSEKWPPFSQFWSNLAIFGSKWPQRIDLSFGTVLFNAKMAINCSKSPRKMIRWSRKRKADQKRSFQSKIRVISSHFRIKNTILNDRSILCGHLEPKMVKIGPKLTEWWPFFQDVLHLGGRPSRSRFPGGAKPILQMAAKWSKMLQI